VIFFVFVRREAFLFHILIGVNDNGGHPAH
jgi:hypothetical protein